MEYDEQDTCWHILTITNGGKVSILKNLDAPTARLTYQKLRPESRPTEYINAPDNDSDCRGWGWASTCYVSDDADISKVHILGPEGQKLDPWKDVAPRVIDLAPRVAEKKRQEEWSQKERDELAALSTKDEVISAWFSRYVAQYPEASVSASELFNGLTGQTLKKFANRHSPTPDKISQKDMENWLDKQGIKSRGGRFSKRFDGIMHVQYGDVRMGNYGT